MLKYAIISALLLALCSCSNENINDAVLKEDWSKVEKLAVKYYQTTNNTGKAIERLLPIGCALRC
jgi:hypothetical protein